MTGLCLGRRGAERLRGHEGFSQLMSGRHDLGNAAARGWILGHWLVADLLAFGLLRLRSAAVP